MSVATLTSKGQTTIPKDIRDHLRLKQGDRLEFTVLPDGSVKIVAQNLDIADLYGFLPRPGRPAPLAEINRAVAKGWARRWNRGRPAKPSGRVRA